MTEEQAVVRNHTKIRTLPAGRIPLRGRFAPFLKVLDARGHEIRGLWVRNGRYYVQMRVPGRKFASKLVLKDDTGNLVLTAPQAKVAMDKLWAARLQQKPIVAVSQKLGIWIDHYLDYVTRTKAKKTSTIAREKSCLKHWKFKLGEIKLTDLKPHHINEFLLWRKDTEDVTGRALNLDVLALNNALNLAIQEGHLNTLPTANRKPFAYTAPTRPLWTEEQIKLICQMAREKCANGDLFSDYIWFMAFSGSRCTGALHVKWSDVNWDQKLVRITSKYDTISTVNFNERLKAHLEDMFARRLPGSEWLFPSPRHANRDAASESLVWTLYVARKAANLPNFNFHDLRHFFISSCIMGGVDILTVAKWVGHKDGGVLIGRVYGHINDEHRQNQAAKVWGGKPVEVDKYAKELEELKAQFAAQQAAQQAQLAQLANSNAQLVSLLAAKA